MFYCAVVHFCRPDAASKLKLLQSTGWLSRRTVAVKVQFTLYSPAPNLFTSVTMLTERSPAGLLLPSAQVRSAQVFHSPATQDYVVIVFQVRRMKNSKQIKSFFWITLCFSFPFPLQLLYLLLSLLLLCDQIFSLWRRGFYKYWSKPRSWLEVRPSPSL